ncbi:hypothetical protein [Microbacterium sp. H1-D42]|uniref:hypothetical protein n=1 Tax=Microbacterium sp. H1-D42 TaxID=2925844 RepID=UPI001F53079E|nr:hypothetical protein [Microbacterium sp. H1-D42]UNK70678.1 hypothetical protein MNR00_16220 [Microbacterium sp. H1-D42]
MPEIDWTNDELRTFLTALRSGDVFTRGVDADDDYRTCFLAQARRRIVPEIRTRVLAEVGATLDPNGVAAIVLEVLEDNTWGAERTWLMVTADPWGYLTGFVAAEIRKAYRKARHSNADDKALKGIEKASSRQSIEAGGEAGEAA